MVDPLAGVWAKIRRADVHLRRLEQCDREIRAACREQISVERDDESGRHVFRMGPVPPVPEDFGLVLGDAIHNLRSALDHLAHAVVVSQGGTPNRNTGFPILMTAPKPKKNGSSPLANLDPSVDEAVRREIDAVQPYHRDDPSLHELAVLHSLDITDKHRRLVLAIVRTHGVGWFGAWELESFNSDPLAEGEVVAVFSVDGGQPPPDAIPELHVGVAIAEQAARGFARTTSAADWLRHHARRYVVEDVLPRLEPLIRSS